MFKKRNKKNQSLSPHLSCLYFLGSYHGTVGNIKREIKSNSMMTVKNIYQVGATTEQHFK